MTTFFCPVISELLRLLILSTFSIKKGYCFLKTILHKFILITPICSHSTEGPRLVQGSSTPSASSNDVRLSFHKSGILFYNKFLPVSPPGSFLECVKLYSAVW